MRTSALRVLFRPHPPARGRVCRPALRPLCLLSARARALLSPAGLLTASIRPFSDAPSPSGPAASPPPAPASHPGGVLGLYDEMAAQGDIRPDDVQRAVVKRLQALYEQLGSYRPPEVSLAEIADTYVKYTAERQKQKEEASKGAGWGSFLSSVFSKGSAPAAPVPGPVSVTGSGILVEEDQVPADYPRGLYISGSPGCGKTFVMDLFYSVAPVYPKKRVHFNKFMLDVHTRLHALRTKSGNKEGLDPIPPLAEQLRKEALLLCFDEFQVLDIADAMTIRRLFSYLFRSGVVMVATSNRPVDELYKNGLQRELFVPFIGQVKKRCVVINMDSEVDYRSLGTRLTDIYFTGPSAKADMDRAFEKVLAGGKPEIDIISVAQGRSLTVPAASHGVARFSFPELCARPLAAADYLAICEHFHTVFVDDIPVLRSEQRNEVRRFILLVDELYQNKIRLVCSAAVPPERLLSVDKGTGSDEVFAFDRCVSRLQEMQSKEYLDSLQLERKRRLAARGETTLS